MSNLIKLNLQDGWEQKGKDPDNLVPTKLPIGLFKQHCQTIPTLRFNELTGLVEVDSGLKNCLRYGPGEFFYYKDLLTSDQLHTGNARAITPLSIFSLNSASFFELIHKHPTLVLDLLTRQHVRLREERISSCHGY